MAIAKVFVAVSLVCLKSTAVHGEISEKFVDLCVRDNNQVDYSEYSTLNSSFCNCARRDQCIRKCCRFGFFHNFTRDDNEDGRCIRNKNNSFNNFSVSLYKGKVKTSETNSFLIGMLNCNNTNMMYQYFKLNNWDPNEKYFLQANGTLFYPNSKRKFYSNDRFCVDEEDGLSVYLCYTPDSPQKTVSRLVNTTGIVILSFPT